MNKPFFWNSDKNNQLKKMRGFGFENIVQAIDSGRILDDLHHSNNRYHKQRLYIVDLNGYAIVVPYLEEEDYMFLKTAFPSRKATKKYLG